MLAVKEKWRRVFKVKRYLKSRVICCHALFGSDEDGGHAVFLSECTKNKSLTSKIIVILFQITRCTRFRADMECGYIVGSANYRDETLGRQITVQGWWEYYHIFNNIRHYTLYIINYTLCVIHYALYTIHLTLCIIHNTLYINEWNN